MSARHGRAGTVLATTGALDRPATDDPGDLLAFARCELPAALVAVQVRYVRGDHGGS